MYGFSETDGILTWQQNQETVQIEAWGRDSLRVRTSMGAEIRDDLPSAFPDNPGIRAAIEILEDEAVISNGRIEARVSKGGKIAFLDAVTERELLSEKPPRLHEIASRLYKSVPGSLYRIEVSFSAYDDERIYGLGQHQHGKLNQKGCVMDLVQQNTEVNIPFMVSNRNYGFLWNNPGVGRVELGQYVTRWVADATEQVDYWITAADTPAEIVERYVEVTGRPLMLPEYASGFWQCKLRYRSQEELLAVAREHKRRGLPLSIIVVDFFHWSMHGDWQFDPAKWPDPAAMVEELEKMGVKVMVSIWPTLNAMSKNYGEMKRRGLLVRNERGHAVHNLFADIRPEGPVYLHLYDATNPEAREFVWEKVREGYYSHGIKLWWLDICEPEMIPMEVDNLHYRLGNGLAVTNIYPLMQAKAFYDGMRAEGETEILTLCRSGWAGSQRYGAAIWSGDVPSTFEALQAQVRAGLNIGLCGIPWWTTDIGGFRFGRPDTPYFRELIVRWFQFGAFCPLFRLHGAREPFTDWTDTGGPNEVWSFGDEAYEIIKGLLFLRERLRPYIMEQMRAAHEKGTPPMRPLFYDFPDDQKAWTIEDEYMFGPDLLVAPVLEECARIRDVYLPGGAEWTDVRTGRRIEGGRRVVADAPIDRIPLYLKGDAKLPIKD